MNAMFHNLRANLSFLKLYKYNYWTGASILFFLETNSQVTLRNTLKRNIDDFFTWLNLDDEDTKAITRETTSNITTSQEIVMLAFDIHHILFGSGNGDERIATNVFELRISTEHDFILKSILCKTSHLHNHLDIQFILYGFQGTTNKDIYIILIMK